MGTEDLVRATRAVGVHSAIVVVRWQYENSD